MSDLRELYQQVILDHTRKPRNFRTLTSPTGRAEGYNPLCGDRLTVEVALEDGVIRDIGFQGSGCAISKASASMMTAALKGKTVCAAEETFGRFRTMLTENGSDGEVAGRIDGGGDRTHDPARRGLPSGSGTAPGGRGSGPRRSRRHRRQDRSRIRSALGSEPDVGGREASARAALSRAARGP